MLPTVGSVLLWLSEEVVFRLIPYTVWGRRGVVVGTVLWVGLHVLEGDVLSIVAAVLVAPLMVYAYDFYDALHGFAVSSTIHIVYNTVYLVLPEVMELYRVSIAVSAAALAFSVVTDVLSREVLDEAAVIAVATGILGFVGRGAVFSIAAVFASIVFVAGFIASYIVSRKIYGPDAIGDGDVVHAVAGAVAVSLLAPDTIYVFPAMVIGLAAGSLIALVSNLVQRRRGGDYALIPFVAAMNTMYAAILVLPFVLPGVFT